MKTYIAMWSGPRNISTALMRSFENRMDCFVSDEPLYAYYLNETKSDHPLRNKIIKSGETNFKNIITYLKGNIPESKDVWYQKHMSHHILDYNNLDWILKFNNCILIRDPKDVIISYSKKNKLYSISQLGIPQLYKICNTLIDNDMSPIIIDSDDIVSYPEKSLKALCKKLNIPFERTMLKWPKGKRLTDGIWSEYWYKNVESSTEFKPFNNSNKKLPGKFEDIYNESLFYYDYLLKNKISIN